MTPDSRQWSERPSHPLPKELVDATPGVGDLGEGEDDALTLRRIGRRYPRGRVYQGSTARTVTERGGRRTLALEKKRRIVAFCVESR